mgnify:FL=1
MIEEEPPVPVGGNLAETPQPSAPVELDRPRVEVVEATPVATGVFTDPLEAAVANVEAPSSRAVYLSDMRLFLSEMAANGLTPHEVTGDDLLRWWTWLRTSVDKGGRGFAAATVNRRAAAVRRLYREGTKRGLFPTNPAEVLPNLRVSSEPKGRALTPEEFQKLRAACPIDGTLRNLRDRLIIDFLTLTGARREELSKVRVEDLTSSEGRRVVTLRRKGGKEETHALVGELVVLIDAWLHRSKITSGPLVCAVLRDGEGHEAVLPGRLSSRSIWRVVSARAAAAGIGKLAPHDLRRTWISAAVAAGEDIAKVSKGAGHSDIGVTQRYIIQHDFLEKHPSFAVEAYLTSGAPKPEEDKD